MNDSQLLQSKVRQLDANITPVQIDALAQFVTLLQKWNKTYNLTAIETTQEIVNKHILDSISVVPYLAGSRIIDVGSGAGLPGIPLAIMCQDKQFVLIDANIKKTRFIQQSIIEIGLKNVQVLHRRVEQYAPSHEFDTVVSRAYAASSKFFETTKHLTTHGQFVLMLGKQTTLTDLPTSVELINVYPVQLSQLQVSRHVAVVKKVND